MKDPNTRLSSSFRYVFVTNCTHNSLRASLAFFWLSAISMLFFAQACLGNLLSQSKPSQSPLPRAQRLVFLKPVSTEKQPKQVCFHPKRAEFYVANMNDASGRGGRPLAPGSLQVVSLPDGRLLHREPARTAVECLLIGETLLHIYGIYGYVSR